MRNDRFGRKKKKERGKRKGEKKGTLPVPRRAFSTSVHHGLTARLAQGQTPRPSTIRRLLENSRCCRSNARDTRCPTRLSHPRERERDRERGEGGEEGDRRTDRQRQRQGRWRGRGGEMSFARARSFTATFTTRARLCSRAFRCASVTRDRDCT